jgi:hypothetical protein
LERLCGEAFALIVFGSIRINGIFTKSMIRRIIYTLLALLCLQSVQGQSVEIKLNLELGKVYPQLMYSKAIVMQEINGQKINMDITLNGKLTYRVKSISKKDYQMEVEYKSLSMSMALPQGSANFDSEKKDKSDVFSTFLGEMVNKPFEITMTKIGKITDVKNIEFLIEDVLSHFTELPAEQLAQLKAQFLKSFGEDAFKASFESLSAIYPSKSVDKGESWEIKTKLESGMTADVISTYTLSAINANSHVIKGRSIITSANRDTYVPINGMPTRYDLSGSMSSEIELDKITGWVIEAKINQEIQGDVYIKKNSKLPDGLIIPMVMKSTLMYKDH